MSYSRKSRYASRSPSPYRCPRSSSRSLSRSSSRSGSPDFSDAENPGNNLYVTGLSPRVKKNELEKHFASEGKVVDVHLVVDPWSRESRGFGFVTMATIEDANRCIKYLDGSVLEGRVITVEKARRRRGRTPTPGRYLGAKTFHCAVYVKEILEGHEARCKREFRMEPRIFEALANCLREMSLLQNSRRIAIEEQLAMFVYTLAHNASNRDVQERFQHSAETVSRYFGKVLKAITSLGSTYIELPPTNTSPVIQNCRHFFPYFKNCIGAIDGTHIPITISLDLQDPYRNRKQTLSQNVMVVCDFNLRFVYVRAGWEGSASDARVLQHSIDQGFYVPSGKYYLVDAGYANTPNFIAPYRGVRYHLQEQGRAQCSSSNYKELFNLRHASLRNHIERIIGVLNMRFPILKVATFHPIDSQTDIVVAACVLHNFIRMHNGTDDIEEINNEAEEVTVPNGDDIYGNDINAMNSERIAGACKRDEIAIQMWNDYCNYRRNTI